MIIYAIQYGYNMENLFLFFLGPNFSEVNGEHVLHGGKNRQLDPREPNRTW